MSKELIQTVYTRGASQYDSLMAAEWDPTTPRAEVMASLGLSPGQSMLDVCVGTGLNFPHYPPGVKVTGIDITDAMLEVARTKAAQSGTDVTLLNMDAAEMRFAGEIFDAALATYALSVVPDPLQVLREMARVTKRGGRVAIWDSILSDIPSVAKNQLLINPFCSRYGIPEGLIVFNLTVDFPNLISQVPQLEVRRFTRYDREDPVKSRCHVVLVRT